MNILIIDNDPIIRKGMIRTLFNLYLEHNLYEAASANEALMIMEKDNIHIVLTDITMPGMDGLTFIEAYRNRFPDTQWVVVSALSGYIHVRRAMKLGVKDYLLKPCDEALLSEVLDKLLYVRFDKN
ncbi:response regulator [Paenibacillus sp. GCM10012306]|uniref:response regulator n=1 Tax=Paenibacillus sp. GCM10012306 TaxID=3317342 RepID=UPI00362458E0